MKIIHAASELELGDRKVSLAIGFFDGVHLGHQQIIRQTIDDARQHEAVALVVTFDQHPNAVVAPAHVPPLIYPLSHKVRAIAALGADALLLLHFDKDFSRQSGEAFIHSLARDLHRIQTLCVGANFTFGYKRSGNVQLLKELGKNLKFTVHGMAAVSLDGKAVSSTRIREAIAAGDLDGASQMLGRAYSLVGTVVQGDGIGRKLGFPTANVDATGLVLPPGGVYAVHARTDDNVHRAVLNIGYRPTLKQPNPTLHVEAHLLDFTGVLYDKEIGLTFVGQLREEKKFASLEQLREQIQRDIQQAQKLF